MAAGTSWAKVEASFTVTVDDLQYEPQGQMEIMNWHWKQTCINIAKKVQQNMLSPF